MRRAKFGFSATIILALLASGCVYSSSFHFDILPQIGRDVEIFAFDNRWLTFFKSSAGDRLELQNFLFRLRRLFGWRFFFLMRVCLFLRPGHERRRLTWHEWGCRYRIGRDRFFKRNTFLRKRGFHRHWFWLDMNLRRRMVVLFLRVRMCGCTAQSRRRRLRIQIILRGERTDNGHAQSVAQSSVHSGTE